MWFYIALLASLVSGLFIVLSKKNLETISPSTFYWATLTISTPFVFLLALKNGTPDLNRIFVIGVIGSVVFYTFSRILQFYVIKKTHLSQIYPLVTLAPIFTLVAAGFPPLSEKPSEMALLGAIISIFGAYVLNISSAREGLLEPFKVLVRNKLAFLMLISVAVGGLVSVFDKLAINNTTPQNTSFVLLIENIVIIFGMLPYFLLKGRNFIKEIAINKKLLFLLGVIMAVSNVLGFIAIGSTNVGIASTIFRSQIFFVFIFSFLFFKDRPKLESIIGTLIMISGLVLIKIGS